VPGPGGFLTDWYGLSEVEVRVHDGGMNSRTWWVDSASGRYVAKWVPGQGAELFLAGLEAAEVAARGGLATGRAVRRDGRLAVPWRDGMLALLERVVGDELRADGPETQAVVGRTLARAHLATTGHGVPGALPWHWVDPRADHLGVDEGVRAAVVDVVSRVDALPTLVTGVCHGDPFPGAFLAHGPDVGLIDWGSPVNGPLLYDVAAAAMYLGGADAAAPMVAAYALAGGPAGADLAHLETMLAFRWVVQADYFAARLATVDLIGLDSGAGNLEGFDDARRRLVGWEA
jgi:homoserine kinase type II